MDSFGLFCSKWSHLLYDSNDFIIFNEGKIYLKRLQRTFAFRRKIFLKGFTKITLIQTWKKI